MDAETNKRKRKRTVSGESGGEPRSTASDNEGNKGGDDALMDKLERLVAEIGKIREESRRNNPLPIMQQWMDDDVNSLIAKCETTISNDKKAPIRFLHELGRIKPLPQEADVKKVIAMCPEALTSENEDGDIPIQSMTFQICDPDPAIGGVVFIPLLAKEASRLKVGLHHGGIFFPSKGSRCGYDDDDDSYNYHDDFLRDDLNILEWLQKSYSSVMTHSGNELHDERCVEALKDLQREGFFDIDNISSLPIMFQHYNLRRLEYRIRLRPELLEKQYGGLMPIQHSVLSGSEAAFGLFLKLGIEYYPHKMAFLFKTAYGNDRAIDLATMLNSRKKKSLQLIKRYIPQEENHPILHYVFRCTPRLVDDFFYLYLNAIGLRDSRGRLLLHIVARKFARIPLPIFMRLETNQQWLEEIDPSTNLYPFMLSASGRKTDLTTIYQLLIACPSMISKCVGQ